MRVIYDPILGHVRQSDFTPGSTTTVNSVGSGVSLVVGPSSIKSLIAGTNITITNNGNDLTITSTGDDIIVVANYSALPAPGTVTGQFYWCSASQGTAWLPGAIGGTYYSAGLYYSNGVSWEFMAVPYQATQATTNVGIVNNQFVSPDTLNNYSGWATKTIAALLTGYVSGAGTITASDSILSAIQKLNGNIAALVTGVSSVFSRTGTVTAQSGDYNTSQVTELTNLYYTNARGIASILTGYTSGAGTVSATDSILQAIQKLNGNIVAAASTIILPQFGGTGIANNSASTWTISGSFATTITVTATTGVTLPTSGRIYSTKAASITSAEMLASMADPTGTGLSVFATAPTFTTSITTPVIYGGTGIASSVVIQGTTNISATPGAIGIQLQVGNNGGVDAITVLNNGNIAVGNFAAPTALLHVGAIAGANGGIVLDLLINSASAATSYTGIDFYVPTTGLIGQFVSTASNYSSGVSPTFLPNSVFLLAEATSGQLNLGAIGSSGIVDIQTGGSAAANLRARFLSTGQIILGGQTALIGTEWLSVQRNANSLTQMFVSNTTSGTAGSARVGALVNGGIGVAMSAYSAAFTTAGMFVANTASLHGSQTGGLNVGTNVSAQLGFWTNNTDRGRFLSSGEFIVGGTALTATEFVSIQKNANALCQLLVSNTTSGTAGRATIGAAVSSGLGIGLGANSALYTTTGMLAANTSFVAGTQTGGLNIGNIGNAQLSIWTNNTLRTTFDGASGNVDFTGDLTTTLSTNGVLTVSSVNANASGAAQARFTASNGTYTNVLSVLGTGFTTSGLNVANLAKYVTTSTVGMLFQSNTASTKFWWTIGGNAVTDLYMTLETTALTLGDAVNLVFGTTTGTKIGSSTSQKIGFWNTVPIIQPTTAVAAATFLTNTSLIANDSATFDGYTIGQIVKALRNIGLLA